MVVVVRLKRPLFLLGMNQRVRTSAGTVLLNNQWPEFIETIIFPRPVSKVSVM